MTSLRDRSASRPHGGGADPLSADPSALSGALLELHRAAREATYAAFQPTALEIIQGLIPFDSAWWGNAAAETMEIHRLHLHNCPDGILADYGPYVEQDFFRAELIRTPGVTVNLSDLITRARFVRTALYRDVGRKYHVEWSLGTLVVEPVSSLYEFLTLWRHDPHRPFDERERRTKELLMPHIVEAHRAARLRDVLDQGHARQDRWAVTDERGFLREASPGFVHWLREHFPDWQGSRVPEPLLASISGAASPETDTARLQIVKRGPFRYLEVLAPSALDNLSPREREVVVRYARGETNVEIALALGLSPATVRNHLTRCYQKLAVTNKAELALRLAVRGAVANGA